MNKRINFCLTLLAIIIFVEPACKREMPTPKAIQLSCNDITSETILSDRFTDPAEPDYVISCNISLQALLTIQPGVIIEFAPGAGLTVTGYGTLMAKGSSTSPIIFRGTTDTPGSWKGIYFESTGSAVNELSYVTVSGGGSESFTTENILANIRVDISSRVKIDYCTIDKSLGNGIYVEGSSANGGNPLSSFTSNSFNGNTGFPLNIDPISLSVIDASSAFTGNGKQFVCLRGTQIQMDQQWNLLQVPYLIDGDITIGPNFNDGSVTVAPGAKLVFTAGSGLIVASSYGYLSLAGTSAQHIKLEGETATAGSWQGINIQSYSSYNQINYTDISYGGCCGFPNASSADLANILVGGYSTGKLSLTNCTINNSASCGVRVKSGSVITPNTNNSFSGNATGMTCN